MVQATTVGGEGLKEMMSIMQPVVFSTSEGLKKMEFPFVPLQAMKRK